MNTKTKLITGIVMTTALLITANAKADSLIFGLGITPRGTSFSIGFGNDHCAPPPPPRIDHYEPHRGESGHRRPSGHYENRVQRVWVEGYWTECPSRGRRHNRIWHPGYWEERIVRVWIQH